MYIQPCCIDKELPALLRAQPHCFFQSNGDWVIDDLLKGIGSLVPSAVALIAMPEVDVYTLRLLRTYLSKDWFRAVVLITGEAQTTLVEEELSGYVGRYTYATNAQVMDGLVALTDFTNHLVVQGPVLTEKDFSLCQFAAYYGREAASFYQATEALIAKVKTGAIHPPVNLVIKRLLRKGKEADR